MSSTPAGAPQPPADETHWVGPQLPTILGDLPALPIPGTDLIFASIEGGFVFPGRVDVPTLSRALAQTLQVYPHAAGRLICETDDSESSASNGARGQGTWKIALLNAPVALTISTAPSDTDSTDASFYHERNPLFVDVVPFSFAPASSATEPLVRLKVVFYPLTGESSLFISLCHVLGDGTTAFGFLHTLSQCYYGRAPVHVPTFEKYLSPIPPRLERHLLHSTLKEVPHLAVDYAPGDFFTMYQDMLERTERVDLQFSESQLGRIRAAVRAGGAEEASTRDALGAYLIAVLNRAMPETPIVRIMNVVDFRGAPPEPNGTSGYTPPSATAAGNLTITHFADIPPSAHAPPSPPSASVPTRHREPLAALAPTLAALARTIRASVATTRRDGAYVRRVVALSEELYARSAGAGRLQWWFPYLPARDIDLASGTGAKAGATGGAAGMTVALNNLSRVDFPGISFAAAPPGVPRRASAPPRARFHTFDSWAHYLRVWPGNPVRDARTGVWRPEVGSLRTFFRVRRGRGEVVRRIVEEDLGEGEEEGAVKARL